MKKVASVQYVNGIENGSDGEETTYCGSCLRGQVTKKAEIYCCECSEMLCETCKLHHGRNKYTSAHKMCIIRTFNDTWKLNYLAAIEKCENHPKEEVKYLCKDHDQLCCNECAIVEHRHCATLVSIASHIQLRSPSLEAPAMNLTKMNEDAKQLLQHETNQYMVVCDAEEAVKEKLRTLKKNIEEELLRMETVLIKSAVDQSMLIRKQIGKNLTAIDHFRDDLIESELKLTAGEEFGKEQHKFLINREMQAQNRRHATDLQQLHKNSTVDTITLTGVDQLCRDFKQCLCHYLEVERKGSASLTDLEVEKRGKDFETRRMQSKEESYDSVFGSGKKKFANSTDLREDFETLRKRLQTRAPRLMQSKEESYCTVTSVSGSGTKKSIQQFFSKSLKLQTRATRRMESKEESYSTSYR